MSRSRLEQARRETEEIITAVVNGDRALAGKLAGELAYPEVTTLIAADVAVWSMNAVINVAHACGLDGFGSADELWRGWLLSEARRASG